VLVETLDPNGIQMLTSYRLRITQTAKRSYMSYNIIFVPLNEKKIAMVNSNKVDE
jgi:hypothetical protein